MHDANGDIIVYIARIQWACVDPKSESNTNFSYHDRQLSKGNHERIRLKPKLKKRFLLPKTHKSFH